MEAALGVVPAEKIPGHVCSALAGPEKKPRKSDDDDNNGVADDGDNNDENNETTDGDIYCGKYFTTTARSGGSWL